MPASYTVITEVGKPVELSMQIRKHPTDYAAFTIVNRMPSVATFERGVVKPLNEGTTILRFEGAEESFSVKVLVVNPKVLAAHRNKAVSFEASTYQQPDDVPERMIVMSPGFIQSAGRAGGSLVVPLAIRNDGLEFETIALNLALPQGWTASVFQDYDKDGVLDAIEQADGAIAALMLLSGEQKSILLVIDIPETAALGANVVGASVVSSVNSGISSQSVISLSVSAPAATTTTAAPTTTTAAPTTTPAPTTTTTEAPTTTAAPVWSWFFENTGNTDASGNRVGDLVTVQGFMNPTQGSYPLRLSIDRLVEEAIQASIEFNGAYQSVDYYALQGGPQTYELFGGEAGTLSVTVNRLPESSPGGYTSLADNLVVILS